MRALLFILSFFILQDLPFKPKEEFEIKLDYQFKQRPQGDINVVHFNETRKESDRRSSTSMLPYLVLKIAILKDDGKRVRITNNLTHTAISKKIQPGTVISLDVGFTDDAKDRVTPHEYTLTFFTAEKKEINRIVIHITEDGSFLVNGEKRGKF